MSDAGTLARYPRHLLDTIQDADRLWGELFLYHAPILTNLGFNVPQDKSTSKYEQCVEYVEWLESIVERLSK